ncbi:MAG: hypothetical protein KC910_20075, partial [Candidatus Eremiobacteraeota bacterium]|nr:hypothetical protein [Candidatus Eremiobacteraeota bacterium]
MRWLVLIWMTGLLAGQGALWEEEVAVGFGADQGSYQPPSRSQEDLAYAMTSALKMGRLEQARQLADELDYRVQPRDSVVLFEDRQARGWGRVVARPGGRTGLIVEAPHPLADRGTPEIAVQVFEALDADFLLLAGAHRRNRPEPSPQHPFHAITDMTHTRNTVFNAWHAGAVAPGTVVLQVHGFSSTKAHQRFADFPESRQIVLSDGLDDRFDPPRLRHLRDCLQADGFEVSIPTY